MTKLLAALIATAFAATAFAQTTTPAAGKNPAPAASAAKEAKKAVIKADKKAEARTGEAKK